MRQNNILVRLNPVLRAQKNAQPASPSAPTASSSPSIRQQMALSGATALGHDEVRFSGHASQQEPMSVKKMLKTVFTAALLGSGLHAATAAKTAQPSGDGKSISLSGHAAQNAPASALPHMNPIQEAPPVHGSHAAQSGPPQATARSEYHTGDMLESPDEALYLAKTGQIAHKPDALKVVTGPGQEKLLYEILLKNGAKVGLSIPENALAHQEFLQTLKGDLQLTPKAIPSEQSAVWNLTGGVVQGVVTLLVVTGILRMMRGLQGGVGGSAGPGEASRFKKIPAARKPAAAEKPVTFADVRGYPEVIRELQRVKERYLLGNLHRGESGIKVRPIKGLLLEGPPGTGKSMMAKALATESKVPFHYVSGSQFVEMYVGVGAARVRSLFSKAKEDADKHGGAIIFIDELDSIGAKRDENSHRGGNEERTNALNELLQQMSGFSDDPRIMVLAATNRKDHLDDALQRSGRFDKSIKVDLPHDKEQRLDILDKYLAEHPTAAKLDRDAMAEFTQGKSGADLANLVNQMAEAAVDRISEARHNPNKAALLDDPEFHKLNTIDFLDALRNMEMGIKREARGTHDERKTVAVHEVLGHGLVARAAKTPLHIVSMQPRGDALGHVLTDPRVSSRKLPTLESMLKDLVISMGGRASEREMLGAEKITPGASGDIAQSKAKIRQMLATRMLHQASGADIDSYSSLNEHDRKLADSMLKQAEQTAEEVIRTVPREKLWALVDKAMNLQDELEGQQANDFYQEVLDTVGADKLYQPIQQFIQKMVEPPQTQPR